MIEALPTLVPVGEYIAVGDALGCAPVLFHALSKVESLEDPRAIRREDHWWRKMRFASREAKAFDRKPNPKNMDDRWTILREMDAVCQADAPLNLRARNAAILCHSLCWSQIMGFNHRSCGFDDPRNWLDAVQTLQGQRECLIAFVTDNPVLQTAFQRRDYPAIAHHYNGPNYRANKYDEKLRTTVRKLETAGVTYA
ncbi:MAG: hypothetical protein C0421_03920 [Hyphomonas sp.]|uniref:N-acetylmuramidase domain-containing protein n=1 Tax=Hyphomonas sp. TaxID=87 RepID=UPI0025B93B3D|nr:N-acetylmuramidase domain-containing protein [Hyphomonas sp.]MBA4337974.1 hypothetical protein [Hyphomonas sp.]